jgi:leucyl aminopeptidase (aminopeptidase T)
MFTIESKRDQHVLTRLIEQVGYQAIAEACSEACSKVAGARRAYPSNIAKALGLEPPKQLAAASKEDAAAHLAEIARRLRVR